MRRHAPPHDTPAERVDRDEARVQRVGARGSRGEDQVHPVDSSHEPRQGRLHGAHGVLDVLDRHDLGAEALDLRPDARLEPLSGGPPDGLLDHDPDPASG